MTAFNSLARHNILTTRMIVFDLCATLACCTIFWHSAFALNIATALLTPCLLIVAKDRYHLPLNPFHLYSVCHRANPQTEFTFKHFAYVSFMRKTTDIHSPNWLTKVNISFTYPFAVTMLLTLFMNGGVVSTAEVIGTYVLVLAQPL